VAEFVAHPPFLRHLAAVRICVGLSSELELDTGRLGGNLLGTSLLGLLPDASPLVVTECQALASLLSLAPYILLGGHRTQISLFHPGPILFNPIQPHSLSIRPTFGPNDGFDLTALAPSPVFKLLVGRLVVAEDACLELHLSGDGI